MKLTTLDEKIAKAHIAQVTGPIKYGENATFFWFPGSGMTTILKDIFSSKKLIKSSLGKLSENLKVFQFFGHLADKKSFESLLQESGFRNFTELKGSCQKLLNEGNEIVYILGRIDDYSNTERTSILKHFIKLNALNPRRIHILFNTIDKPWFVKTLKEHSEFMILANRLEIVSMLKGSLLEEYIAKRAEEFDYKISKETIGKIAKTYGGLLQITKEYLRSKGKAATLELKLRTIWDTLPKDYKALLESYIHDNASKFKNEIANDLEQFGILELSLFNKHKNILNINQNQILKSILTIEEEKLWNYCKKHSGEMIDKDIVIKILRPRDSNEVSFWVIDKAVSRFRSKLAKSGIDPSLFKTVKGRGYIWQN